MAVLQLVIAVATLTAISQKYSAYSQVLSPPYFNLAVGRQITATSTCGVGVSEPELFCKLTGAGPGDPLVDHHYDHYRLIRGQLCDHCDELNPLQSHPPEQAVDGTERWWQSPPLSRGLEYNQVNLTIDLAQEFHVAYVFIKMANSPRPGVFALEKSNDYGRTWKAWQYFADTHSDCNTFFGGSDYEAHITKDDSILCTTEYSKVVPLEGGEIVVSLVNGRPNALNFSHSESLQEWTKATTVRLRLIRTKTLLGHLMAVANQDPTVTRRYYYSIKDISIGGRCVCNGHADVCDLTNPNNPLQLMCRCQHNTCGPQCDRCCPGFVQKPWKPATLMDANECEPCNCHGHSTECYFDEDVAANRESLDIYGNYEGGGVCMNCQHNTEGTNCDRCATGYYRRVGIPMESPYACEQCICDPAFSTGACDDSTGRCQCRPEFDGPQCDRCSPGYYGYPYCQACDCNVNGTQGDVCQVAGGQCPCKPNYEGNNCDRCAYGYYGFPDCQPCSCDYTGSVSTYCDPYSGTCECHPNYGGRDCSQCATGYYGYPSCTPCNCEQLGTEPSVCDQYNGMCQCAVGFTGIRCDQCDAGYYQYPNCRECGCDPSGSQFTSCDARGECTCRMNFAGRVCDRCAPGYYRYPECLPCNCDSYGSYAITCEAQSGQCDCRPNYEGQMCDRCRPNYYNYPRCEECNCNPAGAVDVPGYPLGGCGSHQTGQLCECKPRVTGHICDQCLPQYWNLDINNPLGCEDCVCHTPGTVGGSSVCDNDNGQCVCKSLTAGHTCNACQSGTYNLQEYNLHGCTDCGCDVGGAIDESCDDYGECMCKPRVTGVRCDEPEAQHYFPTLYHHQYELEDGRTDNGGPVRYGFEDDVFPGYSWKGYAVFSRIQESITITVTVQAPSLHHIIYRYVSREFSPVTATVTVTPHMSSDANQVQTANVIFKTSYDPILVTVATPFVLNPGRWDIKLTMDENVFVDYMVLLPQAYYEASILQQRVNQPCVLPLNNELCRHYVYVTPNTDDEVSVIRADAGYVRQPDGTTADAQLFIDAEITDGLSDTLMGDDMAVLSTYQDTLYYTMPVSFPGRYVFVLQYYNPVDGQSQDVSLDVATDTNRDTATFTLPHCSYSSLCRSAAMDQDGHFMIFDLDGTEASLTLRGSLSVDLAVHTIIAVPIDLWSMDYITPALMCVRQDQQCIDSSYPQPAGSVRYEIEQPSDGSEPPPSGMLPPNIIDTTIRVYKMNGQAPTASVHADVTSPGRYTLLVHYFQPRYTGFIVNVNVTIDGQVYRGEFLASYCPSVSGCRAIINFHTNPGQPNIDTIDLMSNNYVITFSSDTHNTLWLDYVLMLPSDTYTPQLLVIQPTDIAGTFITQCGQQDFYISPDTTGFCRDSVFSLVTDYNNGASPCECNYDGSNSFSCDVFGGQCDCKDNVIGRTCTQCRTGYYGFPNCRRCDCPSGLCDDFGTCVCPNRVTGPDCNECLPQTFGFDRLLGCEECGCDPDGVANNNLECDINTGACSCKPSVGGRQCDSCQAGHYAFPECYQCTCDTRGTVPQICHATNAECLCKDNVVGLRCDQCEANTFHLEDVNPLGCTSCFCFGATSGCESAYLWWMQIHSMDGWGITNLADSHIDTNNDMLSVEVSATTVLNPQQPLYWIAPSQYLGNKVQSYGGQLRYTVSFTIPVGEASGGVVDADVRIEGHNMTLYYVHEEQPIEGQELNVAVDIRETSFRHEESASAVSREQFMMVLAQVISIQIRASYYDNVAMVTLSNVELDHGTPDGTGERALTVEQCQCPPNYKGYSCEECADGYYRSRAGTYLGVCVPCECNNRADTCDPNTGECFNCRDNYGGAQCLSCKPGYYQDPYTGRCLICSCPLPIESNNFAETCEVLDSGQQFRCICLEGYTGPRCDSCELGYYGDPSDIGGTCTPCDCSSNIDIRDPRSCSPITGECLMCINNSTGPRCEICDEWYYGDAVNAKNCTECASNRIGAESCDNLTGESRCKPNVIGEHCDRCDDEMFGFDSGEGCTPCACGDASYSTMCDLVTGKCSCQPGVAGRACDRCEEGFWDYTSNGCRKCECESIGAVTCDAVTGVCQCLPGATGLNCDMCMDGWIMVPGEGCQECDQCVTLLLDDLHILDANITAAMDDLDSIAVGAGAIRRLERINNTIQMLRPQVEGLIFNPDIDILIPIQNELEVVKALANDVSHLADRVVHSSDSLRVSANETRIEAESLNDLIQEGVDVANDAVDYVEGVLEDILRSIANKNVTTLIEQAQDMLDEIHSTDFSQYRDMCHMEQEYANETLQRAQDLFDYANDQREQVNQLNEDLDNLIAKLNDLQNNTRISLDNSQAAIDHNERNTLLLENIRNTIVSITTLETNATRLNVMSQDLLDAAWGFLNDAENAYMEVSADQSRLDVAILELNDFTEIRSEENEQLEPLVTEAMDHALSLQQKAEQLDSLLTDTRSSSEAALNASSAYKSIVEAIHAAYNASQQAKQAAQTAYNRSNGLEDQARASADRSSEIWQNASDTKSVVDDELVPRLEDAQLTVDEITVINEETTTELSDVRAMLYNLPADGYSDRAQAASLLAADAETTANKAAVTIQGIVDQLPQDEANINQMSSDILEANQQILRAYESVDRAVQAVPQMTTLIDSLTVVAERVNNVGAQLTADLAELRGRISMTRDEAARINVGVTFYSNSTVQVRQPANFGQSGSFSRVSLFVKTNEQNGLLAYIGEEGSRGQTATEYLALELVDGFVAFKFNLGSGTAVVTSTKRVDDGQWHEIIAERIARVGTLTIRTHEESDSVTEGESPGNLAVLSLDPATAKFYVGGIPTNAQISPEIMSRRFMGAIEDVMFDGLMVGLWDFVEAEHNPDGCRRRDVMTFENINEYRYDGSGYVMLKPGRLRYNRYMTVEMMFKTYIGEGLLFLMGDHTTGDFFALELEDGRVKFQFDLGSGIATAVTNEQYNDGQWHTVQGARNGKNGLLKLDTSVAYTLVSRGSLTDLDSTDVLYFGGVNVTHQFPEVTQKGYSGCMKDVIVGSNSRMLGDNIGAKGVIQGCPMMTRVVSFDAGSNGAYIATDTVDVDLDYQITMKMKTLQSDGLMYYVTDEQQDNSLSIAIINGRITVIATSDGEPTLVAPPVEDYNDEYWHYLTVTKHNRQLQLVVDDKQTVEANIVGRKRMTTTSQQFFGSVARQYRMIADKMGTDVPFVGCIGDVTVNGNITNFALAETSGPNVRLGYCPIEDPAPPTTDPPSFDFSPFPDNTGPTDVQCALPRQPATDELVAGEGVLYGAHPESRLEYDSINNMVDFGTTSNVTLEFRTDAPSGVLLYFAAADHTDFYTVYMTEGRLVFKFNCGSGPAIIETIETFNDGNWHQLLLWREQRRGSITVDGVELITGRSQGDSKSIQVVAPYYVGGLDGRTGEMAARNLPVTMGFAGCIKNLQMNYVSFGTPANSVQTRECSNQLELGSFFYGPGANLLLVDEFYVGRDLDISLEMRPRTTSGILFFVASERSDFLIIQLVNGEVVAKVDNGAGVIQSTYTPPSTTQLCNGAWHHVRVEKAKNVLRLSVNGVLSHPGIGQAGQGSTDTSDPIYIGGVPDGQLSHPGLDTQEQYIGCIRNIMLNGILQNMNNGVTQGTVSLGVCPSV